MTAKTASGGKHSKRVHLAPLAVDVDQQKHRWKKSAWNAFNAATLHTKKLDCKNYFQQQTWQEGPPNSIANRHGPTKAEIVKKKLTWSLFNGATLRIKEVDRNNQEDKYVWRGSIQHYCKSMWTNQSSREKKKPMWRAFVQ